VVDARPVDHPGGAAPVGSTHLASQPERRYFPSGLIGLALVILLVLALAGAVDF